MTANKIIHDIWVGDLEDAKVWDGNLLCVLESLPEDEPKHALLIPILTRPHEHLEDNDAEAMRPNLELISHIIQNHVESKTKLLVHCMGGMERSPLALTWYIHERNGMGLNDAFDYVKLKRPQALNRIQWLNTTSDEL